MDFLLPTPVYPDPKQISRTARGASRFKNAKVNRFGVLEWKRTHPSFVSCSGVVVAKTDYWIAWHRENYSKPLEQDIEIVKKETPASD